MKIKFFIALYAGLFLYSQMQAQTITIGNETITQKARWSGTVYINGDVTIAPTGRLVINPGTRVLFQPNTDVSKSGRDKTRSELIVKGVLVAKGTINNKILFSSASPSPRMQDWYGIQISNPKNTAILEYAVVRYAYNGITIKKSNPQINNSQIELNYNAGLSIELVSKPKIIGNIISENGYAGVICNTGARPVFTDNMITKNEIGLISFGTAEPNLGNMASGNNYNIGRNGLFENLSYNIHNHSVKDILAENVSWGSKDMAEIALSIYDTEDERKYGKVDMSPILGGSLDIESKIILSQNTPSAESTVQPTPAEQQPEPQDPAIEEQPKDLVRTTPEITQEKLTPSVPIPDTSRAITEVKEEEQKILAAKEKPKVVEPAPAKVEEKKETIDFDQVFLDAFLDGGRIITKKVSPVIDDSNKGLKMHGRVIVRIIVDNKGDVESASVLRGLNTYYDNLALEAAQKFKFKAGTIKGNPVRFSTSLFFEF